MSGGMSIEELYRLYADDVYEFAYYSLGSSHDAKDAVQEVFLRAMQSSDQFRNESTTKTWLLRIARNYVYDEYRKKRTKNNYVPPPEHSEETDVEMNMELTSALSVLSPSYRQVLVLRYLFDLSSKDVATILRWSHSKVRVTQHRALKALKSLLEGGESNDPQSARGSTTEHRAH